MNLPKKISQYTIRNIPRSTDAALRARANKEKLSLNALLLDIIDKAVYADLPLRAFNDLDSLIGTWNEDKKVEQALTDFSKIDTELWK